MAFLAKHPRLIGTAVAGGVAALSYAFPQYATALVSISTAVLGWLHLPRPGDVKAEQ